MTRITYQLSLACLLCVWATACGSGEDATPGTTADASATISDASLATADASSVDASSQPQVDAMVMGQDAAPNNLCAEPGSVGNSMGVGLYCQVDGECSGQAAGLCTVAQQPDAPPFCTKICFGFDPNECGEDASCDGDGVLRGCVPNCILE